MLNTPSSSPLPPRLKRGGQPANQNARKFGIYSLFRPGHLSSARLLFQNLRLLLNDPACPLDQAVERARTAKLELLPTVQAKGSDFIPAVRLMCKFAGLVSRAYSYIIPAVRLSNALEAIAQDPFDWFERGYKDCGISRDADSFFPVSKKSALNSSLPAYHPTLATNLTDSQWAILAPLIPPDPHLDWLTGEPPVIIAANRWGFTQYYSTGEINDLVIMENYHQVLQRFPALCVGQGNSDDSREGSRSRGRPHTSPRLLLDAILWKLPTGHSWDSLPAGFPPMRVCRKYYRRLFLSGRWYTLLLALYNHLRLEASKDTFSLLDAGAFTTTSSQKIALSPHVPPTWENYTALFFMQLACAAYTRLHRKYKQTHRFYTLLPVFQGTAALSTGEILAPGAISRPASVDSISPFLDELLGL